MVLSTTLFINKLMMMIMMMISKPHCWHRHNKLKWQGTDHTQKFKW